MVQWKALLNNFVATNETKLYCFSKLNKGKSGLTLRNGSGAILFAQIAAQLDKNAFEITGILTTSTLNQDLQERLRTYSGLFGKKLLIVDRPTLLKMLFDFEEQASFDKVNVRAIYGQSKKKPKHGK